MEQAQYSAALDEALTLGLSYNEIGHYQSIASTQGYPATIAALNSYIAGARQAAIAQAQFEEAERKRKAAEIALAQQWLDNNAKKTQAEMEQVQKDNAARAAAAAAAAAEADKNKPWWEKAWDNLTTGVTAIVQGSQAIIDKFTSDPVGLFQGSMIALGNSGPIGKAVVTILSNIVFGVTDIVKTVFYPPPGTSNWDRVIASAKLVGMAFIGAYLGIELFTGGAMTTAIVASVEEALGIIGAGAAAEKACETFDCAQSLADRLANVDEVINGDPSLSTIQLSEHALQRMIERGITFDQIQNIINNTDPFPYFHDGIWKIGYYDPTTGIFISRVGNSILTVIAGVDPQYIQNLQGARP
jgi:hypothetical protein